MADAKVLYALLHQGQVTWKDVHGLMRLWEEPALDGPDAGHSTYLIVFLAAAALHEDGSLMEPAGLSPLLSHLKYGAHSFCMIKTLETQKDHCTILEAVTTAIDDALEPDCLKPFSQICNLSSYTASLIMSQLRQPRMEKQVPLTLLKVGLKDQVASLIRMVLDITGYSFLNDPLFLDAHLPLLKCLVEDTNWRIGMLDNSQRWIWNVPATLHFLTCSGKVVEILMPIMQVACTKCGTKLGDTKICNIRSRRQNLDIHLNRMLFTGCYTKTSNLTGQDSYLLTQLPMEIMVVLYKELLTQHLDKALELGIKVARWTAECGTQITEGVNLLFSDCKSMNSMSFWKLLQCQVEQKVQTLVFNECQECFRAHEARDPQHQRMLEHIAKFPVQWIFQSATIPICMVNLFEKKVHLATTPPTHILIHKNTYSLPASRSALEMTTRLASMLRTLLNPQDGMIIFVIGGFYLKKHQEDVEAAVEWVVFTDTQGCHVGVITNCFNGVQTNCVYATCQVLPAGGSKRPASAQEGLDKIPTSRDEEALIPMDWLKQGHAEKKTQLDTGGHR
ncbi:hypothetical protein L208DRAFT_1380610 [Tricholoma matsutake]|nr:hypothetical protein L208DRAFT_1380610 [Tricholoma matsutake 945]